MGATRITHTTGITTTTTVIITDITLTTAMVGIVGFTHVPLGKMEWEDIHQALAVPRLRHPAQMRTEDQQLLDQASLFLQPRRPGHK